MIVEKDRINCNFISTNDFFPLIIIEILIMEISIVHIVIRKINSKNRIFTKFWNLNFKRQSSR